jgi:hypothetical protein
MYEDWGKSQETSHVVCKGIHLVSPQLHSLYFQHWNYDVFDCHDVDIQIEIMRAAFTVWPPTMLPGCIIVRVPAWKYGVNTLQPQRATPI